MKRVKTAKYSIGFNGYDTLTTKLEISKREYEAQFRDLTRQADEMKGAGSEFEITIRTHQRETNHTVETVTFFNIGTSDIILSKLECKPGYCFK